MNITPLRRTGSEELQEQMTPHIRYQVFVSSTFRDLHEEREKVAWELLKSDFIPVGMENFSATDDRGWKTIARTINLSDYYVLIVAGMYGSIDPSTGKSWTERECDYAESLGMPILAFIRDLDFSKGSAVEAGENRARLDAFIARLKKNHMVETWSTADNLCSRVSTALIKESRTNETEGNARPGWFRGPLPSAAPTEELAKLSAENRELRQLLEESTPTSKWTTMIAAFEVNAPIDATIFHGNGAAQHINYLFRSINVSENSITLVPTANIQGEATTFALSQITSVHRAMNRWKITFRLA